MSGTTVEELRTLYVKLGGNIEDVAGLQTDAELIDKIEDIYEAGASLPEVTAEDNGDILGVVEGAWAKMDAPSGGAKITYYNATISSSTVTLGDSKTIGDIVADINAGVTVFIKAENEIYSLNTISGNTATDMHFICFHANAASPTSLQCRIITFNKSTTSGTTGTYAYKAITIS